MIQLVGPGGAGKSAVGGALAARLRWPFRDLDREFERRHGGIGLFIKAVIITLDKLALAYHFSEYEFDENDYPEPPSKDYKHLRAVVTKRFPNFGYYNLPEKVTSKISEVGVMVGDAIDDITDIALDMHEVRWRWGNTSELDALWHYRFGYYSHWGNHLRELQFYLYARTYEG